MPYFFLPRLIVAEVGGEQIDEQQPANQITPGEKVGMSQASTRRRPVDEEAAEEICSALLYSPRFTCASVPQNTSTKPSRQQRDGELQRREDFVKPVKHVSAESFSRNPLSLVVQGRGSG